MNFNAGFRRSYNRRKQTMSQKRVNPPFQLRSLLLTGFALTTLCGLLFFLAPPFGKARLSFADPGLQLDPLISDGQFVWGPNVGDFDVWRFLEGLDSPLAAYADEIESHAAYTSVNPLVLLTVLELRYGYIRSFPEEVFPDIVSENIESTAYDLAINFYKHLYNWGSRKDIHQIEVSAAPILSFEGDITEELSTQMSSGTYAIASALSQSQSYEVWQSAVAKNTPGGFTEIFISLFPDIDPLDTSNDINPPSLPPDNFFQLPFPLGGEWTFNGPHSWCGGDACWEQPPDRSSMDFATNWAKGEPYPAHYTVAAAPGIGNVIEPSRTNDPCWYEIDHGDGWMTSYYHLQRLGEPGDRGEVLRNQSLGVVAEEVCNGGFATGAHVHFTLWYNGSYYDLDGIKLSGWTVHSGPTAYTTGFLERGDEIVEVYEIIPNDYHTYYGSSTDFALEYQGNDLVDMDRVKIRIDDPNTDVPGPPADVGQHDFVVEWWMQVDPGDNSAPDISCGPNDNWKLGNILFDRSVADEGSEWGVSIVGGRIAFGVRSEAGENLTLCSTATIDDGEWHHIAIQRNRWEGSYQDGQLWLFVDGILEAEAVGPTGNISYPDDAIPGDTCGPEGTDPCSDYDPFLVVGACKWESCLGFKGVLDDIRFSWWMRYFENFDPPTTPIEQDSYTVGLLRQNEGRGNILYDTGGYRGGTSNGIRYYGGDPAGPVWVYSHLFYDSFQFIPFLTGD
jgi:hypothetical protein